MASSKITVKILKVLQDNYMYLLIDEATKLAAAVDPVNASKMASAIRDHGVKLKAILTTHHHHDHAHGNTDMLAMYPGVPVYGGDSRIQALSKLVNFGDHIKLGTLDIVCYRTPGHTKNHICYYATSTPDEVGSRVVFTGDTMFVAGCGRFFEGTPEEMNHSLDYILGQLPRDTKVYCGHEYTVTNLKFALLVEPQNMDIKSKLNWALSKQEKREPTVPSTIEEERKTNPFMRCETKPVMEFTGESHCLEVMTVLRQRKNEFVP